MAKDQAASVAGGAVDAAKNVAGVAKEQVAQVATEARQQVRNLVGQARSELTDQAQVQQDRAAKGLHSLADQLRSMAEGSSQPGVATDLAHEAADKARQFAGFLENRDPGSVLDEVRSFARQRPGVFLALSLGAGIVAGRLARGLAADPEDTGAPSTSAAALTREPPARPVLDPSPTSVAGVVGDDPTGAGSASVTSRPTEVSGGELTDRNLDGGRPTRRRGRWVNCCPMSRPTSRRCCAKRSNWPRRN